MTVQTSRFESWFSTMSGRVANWAGRPTAFALAAGAICLWAATGPFVGFSELWQLLINTGTTIVTFLMVFLIQNSQNRDTRALQIKLDELILVTKGASNALIALENASATEIDALHRRYCAIAQQAKDMGYDFGSASPLSPIVPPASTGNGNSANGAVAPSAA